MLAGTAEIQSTLIIDPPAVCTAVQEMLTANRTDVSYTLDHPKEMKMSRGDGRQGTLHLG